MLAVEVKKYKLLFRHATQSQNNRRLGQSGFSTVSNGTPDIRVCFMTAFLVNI